MLKKRIIFTLLYNDGTYALSRNFRLQHVGNLDWLQNNYNFSKTSLYIDELVILDVTRGNKILDKFILDVKSLATDCFIPISAGGGIKNLDDAKKLLQSGADKVVLNSILFQDKKVISEISDKFGAQSIVMSVDIKYVSNEPVIFFENGSKESNLKLADWFVEVSRLNIGEVYINSIDQDGTGQGYDFKLLEHIPDITNLPIIFSGGAGNYTHLLSGLEDDRIDAVSTANLFNFIGDSLKVSRMKLLSKGISLAVWNDSVMNDLKRK